MLGQFCMIAAMEIELFVKLNKVKKKNQYEQNPERTWRKFAYRIWRTV